MTNTLQEDAERLTKDIFDKHSRNIKDPWKATENAIAEALQAAFNAGAEKMREESIIRCSVAGWTLAAAHIRNIPCPEYGGKK